MIVDLRIVVTILVACGLPVGWASAEDCVIPWNGECPCTTRQLMQHRRSQRSLVDIPKQLRLRAQNAKAMVEDFKDMLAAERSIDAHQIITLENCNDNFDERCRSHVLNNECDMTSLRSPTRMANTEVIPQENLSRFFAESLNRFQRIAAYVERARQTEQRSISQRNISTIEKEAIQDTMCLLRIHMNMQGMPSHDDIHREIVDPACLNSGETASKQNANYMVFDALERMLHNVAVQFTHINSGSPSSTNTAEKRRLLQMFRD